jgi:hypothetical protein
MYLGWQDVATNETGYKVDRRIGEAGDWEEIANLGANSSSYSDTGLINGTRYYYRAYAYNSLGNSAFSNEANARANPTTILGTVVTPLSSPPVSTDYRLVSFPGLPGFVINDLLSGSQKADWRVFLDNGGSPGNHLGELTAADSMVVGRGYWLLSKNAIHFSDTVTMPLLDVDGSYAIGLQDGWNIIGNPFDRAVSWDAVKAVNGLVSATLFTYLGPSGFQSATQMEPFKGYYLSNLNLSLPVLKVPFPFPGLQVDALPAPRVDWKVQLLFECDINVDSENYVGISPVAKLGLDELDMQKPPPFLDQGSLFFSRPEWESRYGMFGTDFRPVLEDGQVWEFEVLNPRLSMTRLRFLGIEEVPDENDIVLINLHNSIPVNLRETADYQYQTVSKKMSFKLVIGDKDFVEREIQKTLPAAFQLEQNYPNPFNPSTAISFKIPREADVLLEIFSLIGQRLATLAEGRHLPGVYTVVWNSKNQSNTSHFKRKKCSC